MKKIIFLATLIINIFTSTNLLAKLPEYKIEIKNHRFNPRNIEVKENEKFRLIVLNLDKTSEEFESEDLNREKVIEGGKSAYFIIKPLKSGTYKFFGEFNKKTAQGSLVVK